MAVTARAGNTIFVGLEEENIKRMRDGKPFAHHLHEVGSPFTLVIFYGQTYADLVASVKDGVGPDTEVIDNRNRKAN